MPSPFRPLTYGVLAASGGIGLSLFDDWSGVIALPWLKSVCDYSVLFVMGPGMGVLVWVLTERVRKRVNHLKHELDQEHEERFVVLGRIAASVAHEMRNPLQIVRLIAEELRYSARDSDVDLLNRLDHSLARLDQTVMLAYEMARPMGPVGEADGTLIDLYDVVDDVVGEIRRRSGTAVAVLHRRPAVAPQVQARESAVHIVLANLLRNAIEAAGGQEVSVDYHQGVDLQVIISNPGRLSDALLTGTDLVTSTKPEGLGIGIAIARHLSGAIGGTITYQNRDGRAEVRLTLPLPTTSSSLETDHV